MNLRTESIYKQWIIPLDAGENNTSFRRSIFSYNVRYRSSRWQLCSNLWTPTMIMRASPCIGVKCGGTTACSPPIWIVPDVAMRRGFGISDSNHPRYRSRIGGTEVMPGRALGDRVQALLAFLRAHIYGNSAIMLSGAIFSVLLLLLPPPPTPARPHDTRFALQ